jgi:hypothetical protein
MRSALVLVAVVGCGVTDDDAPLPLAYTMNVRWAEPMDRPAPGVAPEVYIDGVAGMTLAKEYPNAAAALDTIHTVELRYGTEVVRSQWFRTEGSCLVRDDIYATEFTHSVCAYQSGDIRFSGFSSVSMHDSGTSYCTPTIASCVPACSCDSWERCTSRVTSTSPVASYLGCAPIGPKAAGDGCSLIADEDGAYDDCGEGLLCVAGTCTAVRDDCGGAFIPGHPPELRLCP